MRERALYAMTFGLGAVTAGLIAYAAWRVLPPEAAPQAVAVAAQEPRATEPRNERDSAMRNAEERAQLALAPSSLLGEDVAKRGGDESRPDGVGEQSVAAAPVSPAPIGGRMALIIAELVEMSRSKRGSYSSAYCAGTLPLVGSSR